MNDFQTLDQPESQRLFGLDLFINRYHIINPDNDQLQILQLRSKNYIWIAQVAIFLALAIVGIVITVIYYKQEAEIGLIGYIMLVLTGIMIYGIISVLVKTFSKKANWHFYHDRLVKTDDFGFKKIIQRNHIKSVFIQETKIYTNGIYSGSDFWLVLKHDHLKKGYKILQVEERSVNQDSLRKALLSKGNNRSQEAYEIAKIIGNYWKIPVSI